MQNDCEEARGAVGSVSSTLRFKRDQDFQGSEQLT